jgi:hypothetical protein
MQTATEKTETTTKTNNLFVVESHATNNDTKKKIIVGAGAIGFAMCFSGILYGNVLFIVGLTVMIASAGAAFLTRNK